MVVHFGARCAIAACCWFALCVAVEETDQNCLRASHSADRSDGEPNLGDPETFHFGAQNLDEIVCRLESLEEEVAEMRRSQSEREKGSSLNRPQLLATGYTAALQKMVESAQELEAANWSDGWTALHEAVAAGGPLAVAALRVMLWNKPDVNSVALHGGTPLQMAARAGNAEVVRMLLEAGANFRDDTVPLDVRPLTLAAESGSVETARLLLEREIKQDAKKASSLLYQLMQICGRKALATLKAAGADINIREGYDGGSVLHWAVREGKEERVRLLLELGVDRNAVTFYEYTALHYAAQHGYVAIVQLLLDGSDINKRNDGWNTPLHLAALHQYFEVVKMLLQAGADKTLRNGSGKTAYEIAKNSNYVGLLELLK